MIPLSLLFKGFLKLGVTAYGGPAIASQMKKAVVKNWGWMKEPEFMQGMALGQVTPGPIMITATFLGYKLSGFWGALMATIAIFSPAFFIITLLIPHYDRLKGIRSVRIMEQGFLSSFVGMLGLVLYNFGRTTFVDIPSVIFTVAAFIALLKKINLSYILLMGAILSILTFGLFL